MSHRLLRAIPILLIGLRAALAPILLGLALGWPRPEAFAICLALALLSDYFDGVIARRLDIATASLRRLDSAADTLFCLAALGAVWILEPQVLHAHIATLGILLMLELGRHAFDLIKFGREASYHMWSSKLWALALFLAFFMLLVLGEDGPWVMAAIGLGILSDLEGLTISLLLPRWRHDVPTFIHAWRLHTASEPR